MKEFYNLTFKNRVKLWLHCLFHFHRTGHFYSENKLKYVFCVECHSMAMQRRNNETKVRS